MRMVSAMVLVVVLMLAGSVSAAAAVAVAAPAAPAAPAAAVAGQDPTSGSQPRVQGGVKLEPRVPVQRPPRDPRAQPPTPPVGTGTVRGRVVDATTGQPLPRVRVRMNVRMPRSVLTDGDGAFLFSKVAAGPILLSAEKATYVTATYPDGRRSMRRSTAMLAEGQTMEGVTLSLYRSGAITGRVVDPYGDPVDSVSMSAIRLPAAGRGNSMRSTSVGGQQANDIGEFRIGRLEPGSYILLASPQRRNFGPRGGDEDDGPALGRTYYPGVASSDQAQPITIEKGQSMTGIEMVLLETTLTKVTGTVVNAKGEPARGGSLQARTFLPGGMNWGGEGGQVQQDGTFELRLQPGEYTLEASPNFDRTPSPQNYMERERGIVKLSVSGEAMTGVVITAGPGATATGRIVFDGRKPPPANLAQGMSVNFRGVGEGGNVCQAQGRPSIAADGTFVAEHIWGTCQVFAGTPGGWQLKAVMHRGTDITNSPINFDGGQQVSDLQVVFTDRVGDVSFEVADDSGTAVPEYVALVFPVDKSLWNDPRLVRTHVASADRDAMMAQMQVQMQMSGGAFFGTGSPGAIVSRQGTASMPPPAAGGAGGASASVPGTAAQSMLRGLLPGDYFAIALDDLSWEDTRDPSFLTQIAPLATRISIADGDAKSVPLRRVTLPDPSR